MIRRIAILLAQDYSLEEIAEETGYDLKSLARLATSDMMLLAVGRLRVEGNMGVDHFFEATHTLEFTDDPDPGEGDTD